MLLQILKERFDAKYDTSLYHQMYHDLSKTNKHFFTPTWSRGAWICVSGYRKYDAEDLLRDEYETAKLMGEEPEKPEFSKGYELWHDLEVRIRTAWDQNRTLEIVFEE